MRTIENCLRLDRAHICDVMVRFSETRRRHSSMLSVRERHLLSHLALNEVSNGIVSNAEREYLGHRSRQIGLRKLALPCLTQPPFLGKLLNVSRSLAGRVGNCKCGPGPSRKDSGRNNQHEQQCKHAPVTLSP